MANVNKVFLLGNLTRDPDVRSTPSGTSVCTLGMAMNRRYTTSQGEDREETCFVDVETWGRQAENCGKYLQKGRPVLVEGRLKQDQWQDKSTGETRSKIKVRAENVQFLGSGGSGATTGSDGAAGETESGRRSQPQSRGSGGASEGNSEETSDMPQFEPVDEDEGQDSIPF